MRARRKRVKQARGGGDAKDRMSNLPDEILIHILSFLKTKEAVRTGILSRRWKSIWASVPTLDLRDSDFRLKTDTSSKAMHKILEVRLANFVGSVMMGQSVPFLEKVAIRAKSCCFISHIESWICAAVEQNVRELQLLSNWYDPDWPRELPQSLFSCKTVVVLKLCVDVVLNFPMTSTCFPNLKVLKLSRVNYKDDNSAKNLFSSCPVLEDLVLAKKRWDNLKTLNVSSCSLKNLVVKRREREDCLPEDYLQKIVIDAPALVSICIEDNVADDCVLGDFPSIIKAKLDLSCSHSRFPMWRNYAKCLFKQIGSISNVKYLYLSRSTISSLARGKSYNLPTFHNLTSLVFFADKGGYNWSWKLMLEFLKGSPVLEDLVFEEFSFPNYGFESWHRDWGVPNCLRSHLKTIKIFGCSDREKLKVRYFLKNAKMLEKMTIQLMKVQGELSTLPRGSKRCQLEFL